MSRTDSVEKFRQVLELLRSITIELDNDLSELTECIQKEEFIPDVLGEKVTDKLTQIRVIQEELEDQFVLLEMGEFPTKIYEVRERLHEFQKSAEVRDKYIEAVNFFMSLQSEDENTQILINERKKYLSALNFDFISEEKLKAEECYVWLYNAFYETDVKKKFSLIYKLAGSFEEAIAMGIQFGTIKSTDDSVSSNLEDVYNSTDAKSENIFVIDEKTFEDEKVTKEQTELDCTASDILESIGIIDVSSMISEENKKLLKTELSSRAADKFGVNKFKNDIMKQLPVEKVTCLVEAIEGCGYSRDSLALWKGKECGYYDLATDKLFQLGYLKRYVVDGLSEFFTLSPRGEKAFTTKESLAFINGHIGKKRNISTEGEHIEDSANSAITRILYNSCYARTMRINNTYSFRSRANCIGRDYFFLEFPEVLNDKTVAYFGISTEDPSQFKEAYEQILKFKEDVDYYIVVASKRDQASAIGKWIMKIINAQIPVWYCGFADVDFFEASSEERVALDILNKSTDSIQGETEESANFYSESDEDGNKAGNADHVMEKESNFKPIASAEIAKAKKISIIEPTAFTETEKKKNNEEYQKMLISGKFYAATTYVKALSMEIPYYESVYRQLSYALNDPLGGCSYNSDTIISVYYNEENPVSDYYIIAAVMRNYFYDQFSYDYSLMQLQAMVSVNQVLREIRSLDKIIYALQKFKTENHRGIDRYADYHEKERAYWEIRLEEIKREAKGYYDNYSAGNLKENASHKRFIETGKLLLGPGSELSEYLQVVINDDREMLDLLEEFLEQNYVKDHAVIRRENIENSKIDIVLDKYWDLAAQNMRIAKKSSDLMGSLRMNLFKKVHKIVSNLCNYVYLIKSAIPTDADPALREYKKIRKNLLNDIDEAITALTEDKKTDVETLSGKAVLIEALQEIKARMEGYYREGSNKFFYVNFLKNDKILLNEDFIPVLDEVLELPEFTIRCRVIKHCEEPEKSWEERLNEIFNGEDDYGSAELILKYLEMQNIRLKSVDYQFMPIEKAISYPQKDMENKREEFIEDLELAQSYGQIDNTIENIKETIIQIMEIWFIWAHETKNYGFFAKILNAFREKIHKDAIARAIELNNSLTEYLKKNSDWKENGHIVGAVEEIKERITQQNYAAAEDLFNRLLTNDLNFEVDLPQVDYLLEFLNEYDLNYRKTAISGTTLKSLVHTSKINKDTKGGNKLLENWPRGAGVGENTLRNLLNVLGFNTDTIKAEMPLQGKIESYLVTLNKPQNGRKSNYKHPISAFGSEAESKGFRVVCLFGKADAYRLIDTFREIGNAKNTIVLLDYALTLADRHTLARKTKTDLSGKIFAVIDRVVLVYLAKHYMETAVSRMLMSVIMPFTSYQPYIDKSADVMPQEIFIGRKNELEKIESPTGVNIVYGGRQLGKTALLRMAKKDIDMNENGDRAIIVNAWGKDYRDTAKAISATLYDEGILKKENITDDWNELSRDLKNRLRDQEDHIPYFLLMIDEADTFIESCEAVSFQPFNALKDIQSVGSGRFKFVVAGLRNIVRFKRTAALSNNSVLTHLDSLTVKPFKALEARELLEVPLSYLGFRFPNDNETEALVSTIFGTTNYFPGLIQLYCTKLIEAMKHDYAGYSESETPPYYVQKEHIKKVLAEQSLQQDIREKFFITLKVGEDDYYYIIALLVAYHYHENKAQNGCTAQDLSELASAFSIGKLITLEVDKVMALMEEMSELNVLQHAGDGRYRFTRHSFCQMMGTTQQIEDELLKYMED